MTVALLNCGQAIADMLRDPLAREFPNTEGETP